MKKHASVLKLYTDTAAMLKFIFMEDLFFLYMSRYVEEISVQKRQMLYSLFCVQVTDIFKNKVEVLGSFTVRSRRGIPLNVIVLSEKASRSTIMFEPESKNRHESYCGCYLGFYQFQECTMHPQANPHFSELSEFWPKWNPNRLNQSRQAIYDLTVANALALAAVFDPNDQFADEFQLQRNNYLHYIRINRLILKSLSHRSCGLRLMRQAFLLLFYIENSMTEQEADEQNSNTINDQVLAYITALNISHEECMNLKQARDETVEKAEKAYLMGLSKIKQSCLEKLEHYSEVEQIISDADRVLKIYEKLQSRSRMWNNMKNSHFFLESSRAETGSGDKKTDCEILNEAQIKLELEIVQVVLSELRNRLKSDDDIAQRTGPNRIPAFRRLTATLLSEPSQIPGMYGIPMPTGSGQIPLYNDYERQIERTPDFIGYLLSTNEQSSEMTSQDLMPVIGPNDCRYDISKLKTNEFDILIDDLKNCRDKEIPSFPEPKAGSLEFLNRK